MIIFKSRIFNRRMMEYYHDNVTKERKNIMEHYDKKESTKIMAY